MRNNLVKSKLSDGQPVFGCFYRYRDPDVAELISLQGFDFLVVDAEHGTITPADAQAVVRSAELRNTSPIIRVPNHERSTLLRYMDTGSLGVQVPMVESVESARQVVEGVKYQPLGQRGLAASRAADYGQNTTLSEYIREANDQTLIVVQIETQRGLEALPDIVQLEEIDVVFLGPADMSNSLGQPGNLTHPNVVKVFDDVARITLEAGKTFGIMVQTVESAEHWRQRGARYISVMFETLLKDGFKRYLKGVASKG